MKKFRMIAPVIAFVFALGTAFAFTPPMQGYFRDASGNCESGDVIGPVNGQCPGGNKTCQIQTSTGTVDARANCNVNAPLLKYN